MSFPSTVADATTLWTAVNNLSTFLNGALTASGDNTSGSGILVASTTGFPSTGGYITIDSEAIKYTGLDATHFTGITRGADGTTAASHSNSTVVAHDVIADHHNALKAEIIAIETALSTAASPTWTAVTSTSWFQGPNGGVGTPVFSFTNDTNTGIYLISSSTHSVGIACNGSNRASFASTTTSIGGATVRFDIQDGSTFAKVSNGVFQIAGVSSNQIQVIQSTAQTNLSFTSPGGTTTRTLTVPAPSSDANVVLDQGNYTIAGTWTFSNALTITPTTNQLVLGTTRTVTISATQPASSSRTWTIPDITGNGTFAALEGTQTFSGAKTFSSTVSISNTNLQISGNQSYPILQVVQGTLTSLFSTTSSTFTATGLKATITPKFNTSKIRILVSSTLYNGNSASTRADLTLKRGTTDLGNSTNGFTNLGVSGITPVSLVYYDSPATTSATTYEIYLASTDNTTTVNINRSASLSVIIVEEIAQ